MRLIEGVSRKNVASYLWRGVSIALLGISLNVLDSVNTSKAQSEPFIKNGRPATEQESQSMRIVDVKFNQQYRTNFSSVLISSHKLLSVQHGLVEDPNIYLNPQLVKILSVDQDQDVTVNVVKVEKVPGSSDLTLLTIKYQNPEQALTQKPISLYTQPILPGDAVSLTGFGSPTGTYPVLNSPNSVDQVVTEVGPYPCDSESRIYSPESEFIETVDPNGLSKVTGGDSGGMEYKLVDGQLQLVGVIFAECEQKGKQLSLAESIFPYLEWLQTQVENDLTQAIPPNTPISLSVNDDALSMDSYGEIKITAGDQATEVYSSNVTSSSSLSNSITLESVQIDERDSEDCISTSYAPPSALPIEISTDKKTWGTVRYDAECQETLSPFKLEGDRIELKLKIRKVFDGGSFEVLVERSNEVIVSNPLIIDISDVSGERLAYTDPETGSVVFTKVRGNEVHIRIITRDRPLVLSYQLSDPITKFYRDPVTAGINWSFEELQSEGTEVEKNLVLHIWQYQLHIPELRSSVQTQNLPFVTKS